MTFAHPLLLLLVPLPLLWVAWTRNASARRIPLLLKGIGLSAVLAAFTQPAVTLPERRTGAVVLVDTSASIPASDLARASTVVKQMESNQGRNWMKVLSFDSNPHELTPRESSSGLHFQPIRNSAESGTNLESALTDSMAAIPSGHIPRLVLITDGKENQGSAARAVAQLQRLHVPVDTIPLAGKPASGVRIESVSLPLEAFSAEQIPIDLTVDSPRADSATLQVYAEGKPLGQQALALNSGSNIVRAHARVKTTGAVFLSGTLKTAHSGETSFGQAIELRRAKVLYVSQDPAGSDDNLLKAFDEASFDVARNAAGLDGDIHSFQLVVLNNLDLATVTGVQKARLESYVKNGGGLLLIGGERQVYKEDKQMDALDRALPAKLAPPDTPEGTSVALIIDKSSSMEGRKIELARISAIGVVDHLRPIDSIGVLIFDNSFQWAVPMRRAEDKSLIKRLISGITPDGGTQIAPALAEAYRRVLTSRATFKHVVLLTDGISEEGDSMDLAKEAAAHQVTISTVGLGQDVNRTYLEKVAATSGGRSYFLNEPVGLEQILLKDVENYSGTTAVEKPLTPIVPADDEVLQSVGMETAPPLKGYVRFKAKPDAQTVLQIDAQKRDPLYVRWQYGLGRAAVFASDAKSRWAENWVTWPGFDKFWINVSRDLLMHTTASEASAAYDAAGGDLVIQYRLANTMPEPAAVPEIFALGPNDFRKPVEVRKISTGVYGGRVHLGSNTGLFRVRPVSETAAFPEVGLFRQQGEMQDYGSNEPLLRQISSLTNGRFNPPPSDIFASDGRTMYAQLQLWPACLALAVALTIAELIVRKWGGLTQRFRRG